MEEVLLAKEEGLRIAISILSGKKANKDYGSASLRDTELILKNILETLQVERELTSKPPAKPKMPNKKRALTPAQRKDVQIAENLMADWKKMTILEVEEGDK
tara:strand:- start:714 stop:1019 length:306 start_codon:yes stop_codon:yes gene_type:complete